MGTHFKYILAMILVCAFSTQALAKCFSMQEAEAEQGIRIHSELMVIGLNCQHLWPKNQKNLYTQYQDFTRTNAHLFSEYEKTLLRAYESEGMSNPEKHLHQVRTDFANKISKDAAVMRPDAFCATYAPRVPKAAKMTNAQIRKWASTIFPNHPVSHPVCASGRAR